MKQKTTASATLQKSAVRLASRLRQGMEARHPLPNHRQIFPFSALSPLLPHKAYRDVVRHEDAASRPAKLSDGSEGKDEVPTTRDPRILILNSRFAFLENRCLDS